MFCTCPEDYAETQSKELRGHCCTHLCGCLVHDMYHLSTSHVRQQQRDLHTWLVTNTLSRAQSSLRIGKPTYIYEVYIHRTCFRKSSPHRRAPLNIKTTLPLVCWEASAPQSPNSTSLSRPRLHHHPRSPKMRTTSLVRRGLPLVC